MTNISIDDFSKVKMKVGTIVNATEVEGSDKLLKLQVSFGEGDLRQILSGIKRWYKPLQLIGKQFVFVTNLEPRKMMGLESQGMIMACGEDKPILLKPSKKVPNGTKVR
ncbi:MAG: Methionine-tRNA ligase [Candidatus Daviesbacteria bacterium GW2011_GWA2_38_24]|uniref:Methionine--tRNA ligase n=1 Tax=Candidatus Daviesbacteria bacterium GW2011_GWA2_38_24 TaxID=1618422 RepID=A0A0G0ML66_9BACT|nr:MAG: Methionine-tRNA ligase [Candidatus Daviesbacteria bacterium GW2011_GWA2_38_24]